MADRTMFNGPWTLDDGAEWGGDPDDPNNTEGNAVDYRDYCAALARAADNGGED